MSLSEDHATVAAYITGVDRIAREMEAKWGVDRLPLLVDDDLRAKFGRQGAKWRAALETFYDADVVTRAILDAAQSTSQAMQRAWAALDAAATTAGAQPVSADVWEAKLQDGRIAAIVRTTAEAVKVTQEGRYVVAYTLDEVANVIDALPKAIADAKVVFPGAKVLPQDRSWVKRGEEIPF